MDAGNQTQVLKLTEQALGDLRYLPASKEKNKFVVVIVFVVLLNIELFLLPGTYVGSLLRLLFPTSLSDFASKNIFKALGLLYSPWSTRGWEGKDLLDSCRNIRMKSISSQPHFPLAVSVQAKCSAVPCISASGSYSHACTISVQAKCLTIPGLSALHNRYLCMR